MAEQGPHDQFIRFQTACRTAGLKLTHQRLQIYQELVAATDHPSAETLHQRLIRTIPTLSLDTVYRTVAALARHGLVHRVETGESQARFEAVTQLHHHLICRRCRAIADFCWPSVDAVPLPQELRAWGKIETKNIVAYGVCNPCLDGSRSAPVTDGFADENG